MTDAKGLASVSLDLDDLWSYLKVQGNSDWTARPTYLGKFLPLALDAWDTLERLGSPEGELTLAQVIVYLACAPKSNAVYAAFNTAMREAKEYGSLDVPLHLRNAPTRLMKQLDYGKNYRYAHDEAEGYAAGVNYFPEEMGEKTYYYPVSRGLEGKIAERLAHFREMDKHARSKK